MQRDNNRGQQEQGAEPDGVLQPSEMRCIIGCHRVKHQNLAGGPKANAAGQAPKQIVFDLSAKIELLPFDRQITWIKFEAFALAFSYKKEPMQAACHHKHQHQVAQPNLGDPSK